MSIACAAEIIEVNYDAILSEAAGSFDRAFLLAWVVENKEGFFLRDETSPLDCLLIPFDQFFTLYHFERGDVGAMFRRVAAYGNSPEQE